MRSVALVHLRNLLPLCFSFCSPPMKLPVAIVQNLSGVISNNWIARNSGQLNVVAHLAGCSLVNQTIFFRMYIHTHDVATFFACMHIWENMVWYTCKHVLLRSGFVSLLPYNEGTKVQNPRHCIIIQTL